MRNTGPTRATVRVVVERDGVCLRCRRAEIEQIHHRQPRGLGGTRNPDINSPANLISLCAECHHYIEINRVKSRLAGWLVSHWDDPKEIPISTPSGLVWLTDDGRVIKEEK